MERLGFGGYVQVRLRLQRAPGQLHTGSMPMRGLAIFMMLAVGVAAGLTSAQAQVVQQQFAPPPPIVPLHSYSAPDFGVGVVPSVPAPGAHGHAPSHYSSHRASRYAMTHRGRVVAVPPGRPGYNTFSDRVLRCTQAGSQVGLNASHQGAFVAQCAN